MISVPGWLECQECGRIFKGLVLAYCVDEIVAEGAEEVMPQLPQQACSACGSTTYNDWSLPDSLDDWLITVDETVTSCEADRDRIGAVFVASACEAMLREVIEFLLQRQHVSAKLISYLVDSARGREALLKLYNVVAPSPMHAVLEKASLLPWSEAWQHLAQARNKYAHGRQASESLTKKIHVVARHMDEAFIALRNAGLLSKAESRVSEST